MKLHKLSLTRINKRGLWPNCKILMDFQQDITFLVGSGPY